MWQPWCQCPLSVVQWLVVQTHCQCYSGPDLNDGFCSRLASCTDSHCLIAPHQNKRWTTHYWQKSQKRQKNSRGGWWLLIFNYFLIAASGCLTSSAFMLLMSSSRTERFKWIIRAMTTRLIHVHPIAAAIVTCRHIWQNAVCAHAFRQPQSVLVV